MHNSGIDEFLATADGATKTVTTPNGAKVTLRPATTFELGDLLIRFPMARQFLLGGGLSEDMSQDDFLVEGFKSFRGALCALVACCANRPGDEKVEAGLQHKQDSEFFPLVATSVELTFPLGLAGYEAGLREHLKPLGIELPQTAASAVVEARAA
ncbi:hypothetical protein [Microvirga yunnanensis]|uniref:hypothetical protein n=1 Tax=Microvirga yunnanensis TaxID=2953740 RepID=UPI0021C96BD3|nr:hypothetical protein [Microvirga sp. HBU67655]